MTTKCLYSQAREYGFVIYQVMKITQDLQYKSIAQFSTTSQRGLACDSKDGTIYVIVSGVLSRLDNGSWTAVRPITVPLSSCCYTTVDGNHYMYVYNNELFSFSLEADASVQLTIHGLNLFTDDDQYFMRDYPNITISRTSYLHYCAEEIYQSVTTQDDSCDLFLVVMNSGVVNLAEKGYVSPLSPSEILKNDRENLYGFAQDSCTINGEMIAYPYDVHLGAWSLRTGYAGNSIPTTIDELISYAASWDTTDNLPLLGSAYRKTPWSAYDYTDSAAWTPFT